MQQSKDLRTISLIFGFALLAVILIMAGCGGSTSSGTALSPDFFTSTIEGEITVSAYDSMNYRNYLEDAARGFEALYPGTKIIIETFSAMPIYTTIMEGGVEYMMVENLQI